MGTWGQPGYVFRDFCLKQGIFLNSFVIANGLNKKEIFIIVLHRVWFGVKCLKQGIKNRNSVLNRVGKSAVFVLNRVRVGQGMRGWAAPPHPKIYRVPTHPPPPGCKRFLPFFPTPFPPLLVATFSARSLTLVPRSLLIDRTETPATRVMRKGKRKTYFSPSLRGSCFQFPFSQT